MFNQPNTLIRRLKCEAHPHKAVPMRPTVTGVGRYQIIASCSMLLIHCTRLEVRPCLARRKLVLMRPLKALLVTRDSLYLMSASTQP